MLCPSIVYLIGFPENEGRALINSLLDCEIIVVGNLTDFWLLWDEKPGDVVVIVVGEEDSVKIVKSFRPAITIPLLLILPTLDNHRHCQLLQAGASVVLYRQNGLALVARQIEALLQIQFSSLPTAATKKNDIELDMKNRFVRIKGQEVTRLSRLETRLLAHLMQFPGKVFTAEELLEIVYGLMGANDTRLIHKLVFRLRQKIESDRANPQYLSTIPNLGYSLSL